MTPERTDIATGLGRREMNYSQMISGEATRE
jgi:hypothetical protein